MSVGFVGCCGVGGGGLVSRGKAVNEQNDTSLWSFFESIYLAGKFCSENPRTKSRLVSQSIAAGWHQITWNVHAPRRFVLIGILTFPWIRVRVSTLTSKTDLWAVSYCINVFQLPSREPTANHCPSSRWELSARLLYIINVLSFFSFQRFPPVKRIKTRGRTIFNENFQRLKYDLIHF